MPRRSLSVGGYGITVEVPPGFGDPLLRRLRGRRNGEQPEPEPMLRLVDPPVLNLRERDPMDAVAPYRDRPEEVPATAPLEERVRRHYWYHTIELPGGIVTEGAFDHRPLLPHYGLPDDLKGTTALDVASFDGFWAFELEKRGADVTSVDIGRIGQLDFPGPARAQFEKEGLDRPHVPGFDLAAEALGSRVKRIISSIYDLNPAQHGTYDFVHVADVLLHLESPTRALRAVRSVCGKRAMIVDAYDPELADPRGARQLIDYRGGWSVVIWSVPSLDTLAQMVIDAGFSSVRVQSAYRLGWTPGRPGLHRAVLIAEV